MIASGQLDELRVGYARRDVASFFDIRIQVARAMKHECRNANGRQNVAHVDQSIHARQRHRRAWTGAATLVSRPPIPEALVVGQTRRKFIYADGPAPFFFD